MQRSGGGVILQSKAAASSSSDKISLSLLKIIVLDLFQNLNMG